MNLKKKWLAYCIIFSFFFIFIVSVSANSGLLKEIPNFVFEKDSDWNDAFWILDYFDINGHPSGYYFANNSENMNGEYIKAEFIMGGYVKFKPAPEFIGSREFELHINDMVSNKFNVTIVENLSKSIETGNESIKYGSQDLGIGVYMWVLLVGLGIIIILLVGLGIWYFKTRKKRNNVEIF